MQPLLTKSENLMMNIQPRKLAMAAAVVLSFASSASVNADVYDDAVAATARPAEDRARDAGRRPGEVLEFFGISAGQTVVDISSGGGYYTRMVADIVGSDGKVIAQNNARRVDEERMAELVAMYEPYGNVEVNLQPTAQLDMPDNSVDAVLLFLIVHHWHFNGDQGEVSPTGSNANYANILRMLKPGGTFAVIEHLSPEGLTREASAALHRIPAATAISDITDAGFVLSAESDLLADHPEDDITVYWSDNTPRGQTQRIVHKYTKAAN
jgi:predicted methyltransferase